MQPAEPRPIRWGMIGCGDVTEVKSGPAFQKATGSALVAVMRRNGDLARDYARRHGVPRWYDSAGDLIADPEVDAVYIATPPVAHMGYTIECARAGKPVYVEKPMAMSHAECQAMIAACRDAGVPLFVAYYRRALARFVQIKQLIDSGAIGAVRSASILLTRPVALEELAPGQLPWRVMPEIAGGGHFVDLGSHMLDLLDFLVGPIRTVHGFASNQAGHYAAEDIVSGAFQFESGAHGVGTWCFSASENVDRTEIIGSAGTISYATFSARPVVVATAEGRREFAFDDPPHIQQPLIQTVVDALRGLGTCPSTGESAARTSRLIDQLLHAEQCS
jgi:predicted dehydrogenase